MRICYKDQNLGIDVRFFFSLIVKCVAIENSLYEAFNTRILEASYKSIYLMLENIKKIVMERIYMPRANCMKWKNEFGPRIEKKLEVFQII